MEKEEENDEEEEEEEDYKLVCVKRNEFQEAGAISKAKAVGMRYREYMKWFLQPAAS